MRFVSYLISASALVLVPFVSARAQDTGKNLALDFRTTVVVQGAPDTGVITGHAVGTAEKMRLDVRMKGPGAQVSPLASDSTVTMIVTDSGKTITYLNPRKGEYLRVRPAEMIAQAQQMGGMKMDFTATQAKVDSLGAGPTILGHPTSHYRVATGMTITISAMGQAQSVQIASTSDTYFATDIKGDLNPFQSLSGGDMMNVFGSSNKDFADKIKAVQQKLPKGTPLRALGTATMVTQGRTKVTSSVAEVTALTWVARDPKVFEVPSTYTPVQMPGMGGPSSGAIPPK